LSWIEASGQGTVRSFVVMHHPFLPGLAAALPYTLVKVVLSDHPDAVMHGRLTNGGGREPTAGDHVEVAWDQIDDHFLIPNWRLA
jgi:hypothetical protein